MKSGDLSEVESCISLNISLFDKHLEFIRINLNLNRTERDLVLFNLLGKARLYLHCLRCSLSEPTELLGFLTRSLFELNIITRYVLMSEENLKRFGSEFVVDKKQILQGLLTLGEDSSREAVQTLEKEIARIEEIAKKHNRAPQKSEFIKDKAREVGLSEDYEALYKLFSKYVHPSSYTINATPEEIHSNEVRNIFLIYSQIYADDMFQRIKGVTSS